MNLAPSDSTCSFRGPHVGGLDHRAEALGRGNGLQAGHADAEDDHARRLHGAGRSSASGRSAGTCPPRSSRPCSRRCWPGWTARPCSGARGARRGFRAQSSSAGGGQAPAGPGGQRVEHAHQGRSRLHQCTFIRQWAADLEHQLAAPKRAAWSHDLATDGLARPSSVLLAASPATLHAPGGPGLGRLLSRLRGDAATPGSLRLSRAREDANLHELPPAIESANAS